MPPLTLLAVTADPMLLRLLQSRYTAPEYLLIAEASPLQAAQGLRSFAPDLIVLDGGDADADFLRRHAAERGLTLLMLQPAGTMARHDCPQLLKPFAAGALFERIENLLPAAGARGSLLASGDLRLNRLTRRVSVREADVPLHARTFELLAVLMRQADRVFTREQLLDSVWGDDACIDERTVDVFIGRLRRALAPHGLSGCIETVRSAGYRFCPPPATGESVRPLRRTGKTVMAFPQRAHA